MKKIALAALASLLLAPGCLAAEAVTEWRYHVYQGDTLWSIATLHLKDVSYIPALQRLNRISNAHAILTGRDIRIPLEWMKQRPGRPVVMAVTGNGSLKRHNGSRPLVEKQELEAGDIIETAENAVIIIRYEDGSVSEIGPKSRLTIRQTTHYPSTQATSNDIRLERGSIDSRITRNPLMPNRYDIQTPSAVTAVRGTQFRVRVDDPAESGTEVLEGKVEVRQDGRPVNVSAGYGVMMRQGRGDSGVESLPAAPDLAGLPAGSAFPGVQFAWPAVPRATAYAYSLQGESGQYASSETTVPRAVVRVSDNGRYLLTVRGKLPSGLNGYPSVHAFSVHAFPPPPFIVEPMNGIMAAGNQVSLNLGATDGQRWLVEFSRDRAFAAPVLRQQMDRDHASITLPQAGIWFWRAAQLDAGGVAGPFGEHRQLEAGAGFRARLNDVRMAVRARAHPVDGASYALTLSRPGQEVVYRAVASQPVWVLPKTLPSGPYRARIDIDAPDYHEVEQQEIQILG
ncbi:hypothetical protein GCM10027202_15890 [Microvirgula curvata]